MSVWVITSEVNDYRQHGEYFVSAYPYKPTPDDIMVDLGCTFELSRHIDAGGGRRGVEDHWYNFRKLEDGECFGRD